MNQTQETNLNVMMTFLNRERTSKQQLIKHSNSKEATLFWEGELNQIEWTIRYLQSCGISAS